MSADKPLYSKQPVNHAIAKELKDYELTHRVFTNLVLSMQEQGADSGPLREEEVTVYCASLLDMQVLNGGIYQYFSNYEHRFNKGVVNALRNLMLHDIADRFEELTNIADEDYEVTEKPFKTFDNVYYTAARKKSMDAYLKEYIVAHMDVFELK